MDKVTRTALEDEIADVAIYLIRLADVLGVDVREAVLGKLERNETRYTEKVVQGRARMEEVAVDGLAEP